jgi:hypothetical protein
VRLQGKESKTYVLKVSKVSGLQNYIWITLHIQTVALGETGRAMISGEFESLKAIHAVSPGLVPKPVAWGKYDHEKPETYFLLTQFREVGK